MLQLELVGDCRCHDAGCLRDIAKNHPVMMTGDDAGDLRMRSDDVFERFTVFQHDVVKLRNAGLQRRMMHGDHRFAFWLFA